jgi:hypothetical protein
VPDDLKIITNNLAKIRQKIGGIKKNGKIIKKRKSNHSGGIKWLV